MSNIVTTVAQMAGGIDSLSKLHGVSYQAAWQWEKNGYFPPSQMETVLDNFPKITIEQLFTAYRNREKNTP